MADSLIDVGKLAEPISKLVEAVRAAVGVAYEPTQIRRIASAEADAALIKAEGDAKIDAFQRRVQTRITATEMRRQRNIEEIVGGAVEALPSAVSTTPIEPDWVAEFFNQSQDVSNETMQSLWSRILAGEVASPGSYSLRTLHAVRTLTKAEAELFAHACRFAVLLNGTPVLVITSEYFQTHELTSAQSHHLQALGLMQDGMSVKPEDGKPVGFSYNGKSYEVRIGQIVSLGVGFRLLNFTQVGLELLALADARPVSDYIGAIEQLAKKRHFSLIEI